MAWNQERYNQGVIDGIADTEARLEGGDGPPPMEDLSDSQYSSEYGLGYVQGVVRALTDAGRQVDAAKYYLAYDMDAQYWKAVQKAEESDDYVWILDPEVPKVVGLVRRGTNSAMIVVYLDQGVNGNPDWESNDDILSYVQR